jgi:TolB-like protein
MKLFYKNKSIFATQKKLDIMKKILLAYTLFLGVFTTNLFAQSKTIVGIMPFTAANENGHYQKSSKNNFVIAIQDAVSDAFLETKRFTLVEREKMELIRKEKLQQQTEEFIDGSVVEQTKSLGASYIVTGNILEAGIKERESEASMITGMAGLGGITARKGIVNFNIKVIDIETGEILASEKFVASENGKKGFDKSLDIVKPQIKEFIQKNFKTVVSIVSIEDKTNSKILIAGGTSLGLNIGTNLKIYEEAIYNIDGKRIIRKKELGKGIIEKIEDDSFAIAKITVNNSEIISKLESGTKIKCEIID